MAHKIICLLSTFHQTPCDCISDHQVTYILIILRCESLDGDTSAQIIISPNTAADQLLLQTTECSGKSYQAISLKISEDVSFCVVYMIKFQSNLIMV